MWKVTILMGAVLMPLLPARAADMASLDERLAQVARWDYDQSREGTRAVADMVTKAEASESGVREVEARLDGFLQGDATLAGKDFVCKQLSLIGSVNSVPVLSRMLLTPDTAEMARYALERIPGPAVDLALAEALAKTSGHTRIGIIDTLGRRRSAVAVRVLKPFALGTDAAMQAPALLALANIADPAALAVLASVRAKAGGDLRVLAAEASLRAAERLSADGQGARALAIAHSLYGAGQPSVVRAGAFRLIAAAGGAQSSSIALAALSGPDRRLQAMAIAVLAQHSPTELIAEIPRLGEAAQIHALEALAETRLPSTLPAFTRAAAGSVEPVRVAALAGMAKVGNESVVLLLANAAVSGGQAEQSAAQASLAAMPGKDVDRAVIDSVAGADTKVKIVLIRAAGERVSPAAGPVLLKAARDSDHDVRHEALRALQNVASPDDIPGLLALVSKPAHPDDREDAVHGLGAVLRRSDSSHLHAVASAYSLAPDSATRAALLEAIGESGKNEGLPLLRSALADENPDLRRAAILGVSAWPDDSPVPELLAAARSGLSPADQALALRGVIRLVALPGSSRTAREKVGELAAVMGLAKQVPEKRAVLALLPRFPTGEALDIAHSAIEDSDVAAEARAAAARLERTVKR